MNHPTPKATVEAVAATPRPVAAHPPGPVAVAAPAPGESRLTRVLRASVVSVVVAGVVLGFLVLVLGVQLPGMAAGTPQEDKPRKEEALPGVHLVPGKRYTVSVPDDVLTVLGIRKGGKDDIHDVKAPDRPRPLVVYGSTAFDPAKLFRIRARFAPAEVVKVGQFSGREDGKTKERELRPGDRVRKGDELGVFFSVDVGSKKNDLLDALVQLELDQKIMDRIDQHPESVPEVFRLTQWRAVQSDRNAINRALNNLIVWNIPQEEIDTLHDEAKKISADQNAWFKTPEGRWVKGEKQTRFKLTEKSLAALEKAGVPARVLEKLGDLKGQILATREEFIKALAGKLDRDDLELYREALLDHAERVKKDNLDAGRVDPDNANDNPWGKVTLRAPDSGIIVERNVAKHEIIQDPTTNLFQIAQVDRLLVIANAPEDDLPTLNALKDHQRVWTVSTVGASVATGVPGRIEEIGYLIDPNQHTAIIKGYIDNKDEQIRAGQFVSATIQIPPPADVVEVPIDAIVEDGKNCVVFVETDWKHHQYTMRRVQVTHRFEKTVYIRSKDFDVSFTGSTTRGEVLVTGVSGTKWLSIGQAVSGPGIPAETTITEVGPTTITLSQPATETARGVSLAAAEHLTAEEKEQKMLVRQPLKPGERILKSGVGELKAALIDLESSPAKE
jgi:cobalt-zinc-cadmium efflux system membrane fusion protein